MRRRLAAVALAATLALGGVGGALLAGPAASAPPSDDAVRDARGDQAQAERDVTTVENDLAALRERRADARAAVQSAAEDYAAADTAVEVADAEVEDARAAVTEAEEAEADARGALAALYRAGRQGATGLETAEALLDADALDALVERQDAERVAGRTVRGAVEVHATATAVADTARARADAALDHQATVERAARAALDDAQSASTDLDEAVHDSAAQRERLLAELAGARQTTVEAERERQDELDERATRAEEERARDRVQHPPGDAPSVTGRAPAVTPRDASTDDDTGAEPDSTPTSDPPATGSQGADQQPRPAPSPSPTREPVPEPDPPVEEPAPAAPPGTSAGSAAQGQAAVAWARARIGAPYVFGGTGPGYDCSGLTSRSWSSAGVDITRTSRSQYQRVQKIAYDRLRPGDLIFYANDTSNPSTIRHVAIYSGGGRMVEAPQPGVDVREVPVRWTDAMPYAGRP